MPSIICHHQDFDRNDNTTWSKARRDGVRFLGAQLSVRLSDKDINNNFLPSITCVLNALKSANLVNEAPYGLTSNYGLWIDDDIDVFVPIISITQQGSNKIKCVLEGNKPLTLTVVDDDEIKTGRKMTVVVPGDRSRVIGDTSATLYVLGTVDDINAIYTGPGTIAYPARNKAAHYTLASITFRRCA